ncbi:MAG TPA: S8/S53 family peptidase [Planococcus sp. (in: firmicutes)]|nr:S8/S53 family peptidase [Planococcus sp. (in: firmicutes)]
MKKSYISLLSILLVIILLFSGFYFLKDKTSDPSTEKDVKEVSEENPDKTITYENGDFIYTPANEEIAYDSGEEVFFYENLLNLFLISEISNEQAEELADGVGGKLVGKMQGSINMLQIQVEEVSLKELNHLADRLEKDSLVKFAGSSTPSFISDLNSNDVVTDSEQADEANPGGYNWWAEAINAYSAWDYMDENEEEFEDVKVVVLESGKLDEKDDSINKKKVTVMPPANVKGRIYENKPHAKLVTKIIAAEKNSETIRGVAEPIAEIDFISMGNVSPDEILGGIEASNNGSKSEAEIIGQLKTIIEDDDLVVINNSWGNPPDSETKWNEEENWFNRLSGYDEYLKATKESNDEISEQLIIALDGLLQSGRDNFLIIQSAGNGYSRTKNEVWDEATSLEAKYTGLYTNINKDTYKEVSKLVEAGLDEILNHIIIVGGAEQTSGKNAYQSPDWVSYGAAVDIAAPASDLFIDRDKEVGSYKCPLFCGTSFAAPMVSGAAALAWSYNPEMKAGEIKELLLDSAKEKVVETKGDKDSYPMLDMTAFLNAHPFYNSMIETYRTAINEQWGQSELVQKGLGPLNYDLQSLSSDYGYELRDINGNGKLELVLGVYREDGEAEIHEIYTLQNEKPIKLFEVGLRTNVNIYKDGTIKTCSSVQVGTIIQCTFYQLNDDGTQQWQAEFEKSTGEDPVYKSLTDPDGLMAEVGIETINEKYKESDIIGHSFIPFVLNKEDEGGELAEVKKNPELSDDEIDYIMRENYRKLEMSLSGVYINNLFDTYYSLEDGQRIWDTGVNPNDPFYKDIYELLYPEVKELAVQEGMEFLINEAYSIFWQPTAPGSFYGPSYDLEVLTKDSGKFKVKQTKEIGPQDIGGTSYEIKYIIDFVKEDDKWKFAGAEKQE